MAFIFKLELEDGTPADPPTLEPPCRCGHRATRSRWADEQPSASSTPDRDGSRTELPC
jgi:hypothetical protein